ncbi:unnamed protein product [Rotaria sp. Silwood2]|nr:unnamed protein product [Rotaria sp. Silwood2]CAF2935995.1 unnamed protein product [Rotaria sp. Silwood2]CAF3314389.1 unnamed protein product [Rotaria sp. Silwood2]CAF3902988.1 unnamed protein product [Rotaria sp. Silwood2]CAF3989713.1 unnamed protein product [Rotaria sp. Silwood2]
MEVDQLPLNRKKKRCHGNRKLQRFKRKWRYRGLNEQEIQDFVQNRQHPADPSPSVNPNKKRQRSQPANEGETNTTVRSLSQLSISQQQPKSKKRKVHQEEVTTTVSINSIPIPSIYLKMPKKLLYCSLPRQLNCRLKKKREKRFVFTRLRLLDQQFCTGMDQYLYQSYLDIGSHSKRWPVSRTFDFKDSFLFVFSSSLKDDLMVLAQTKDSDQVEHFLRTQLVNRQQTFEECSIQLTSQATSCPITMKFSSIEDRLKEFVRLHHLDLVRRIHFQINDFKGRIIEHELFQQWSSS